MLSGCQVKISQPIIFASKLAAMNNRKEGITERRAKQILKKHQIRMPVKQLRKVLDFMDMIAKITIDQHFKK